MKKKVIISQNSYFLEKIIREINKQLNGISKNIQEKRKFVKGLKSDKKKKKKKKKKRFLDVE